MNNTSRLAAVLIVVVLTVTAVCVLIDNPTQNGNDDPSDSGLPEFTITGETDLPGNFFVSFVYTKNLIMFDGKGNIVWYLHKDLPDGVYAGTWDFKKHIIDGKVYYSYHDQKVGADHYGLPGYAPGERVILDSDFNEVKRITFEQSNTVDKGHLLDGHDFLLIDLNHYIMSGYIKDIVYNVPDYPEGSSVVYSYLQEVQDGAVVWDWKSIDYPEIYSLTVEDATYNADDFGNLTTDAPDYVHFNAMRLNDDGDLVCSFRHLNTIMCLDRGAQTDAILWMLSGKNDMFGLSDSEKTSSQHYVTVDGNTVTAFDNHNITEETRVVTYTLDFNDMELESFDTYRIDGKFSSACGSAQRISGDMFMLGWGKCENDNVCMCVYDFAEDKELIRMQLAAPENFTYRCVYYE